MSHVDKCFRDDGSYDFKKREDWDYKHTYGYMAGWLGQDEYEKEKKRKRKLGTTDMTAPPLPQDPALVANIEKTAKHVQNSSDPTVFERYVTAKHKGNPEWDFLREDGTSHDYYRFCRHCAERNVDPHPLAEQVRKVKEDRELKERNTKNNVFAAGTGTPAPKKEAVYKVDETMEILGLKNKPDYNGKIVRILKYHPDVDRYEVRFEGGRYNSVIVKLKEENLMYSAVKHRDEEEKPTPEGEIPNGIKVEIRGLQNESVRWMNGQMAVVVCWEKDVERYEVRLEVDNTIKKVKPLNLRVEVPDGWAEHWDEHTGRYYYLHKDKQQVTWKHPTVANTRSKIGVVRENNAEEFNEVEIDAERKTYEVDEHEEMEGNFDLHQLVKKVEEREERRLAAEERGEEDFDSDDGMHKVAKKRKKNKKKEKISVEHLQIKVAYLIEETLSNRATPKKDYTLLEGNFATKDMDQLIVQLESNVENASEELLRATFEVTLGLLEKGTSLMLHLKNTKLQATEMNKRIEKLTTLETPADLLEIAKWVYTFLRTM